MSCNILLTRRGASGLDPLLVGVVYMVHGHVVTRCCYFACLRTKARIYSTTFYCRCWQIRPFAGNHQDVEEEIQQVPGCRRSHCFYRYYFLGVKLVRPSHSLREGIAACNVGGVTIHSFAGIGIGADTREALLSRVKKNKKAMTRWLRTKILIIDEGAHIVDLCDC